MQQINIFWFRRDLRLHDNTGLYYALKSDKPVLPIFIFDTQILDQLESKADARVNFIHDQIKQLKAQLEEHESSIKIFNTNPLEAFKSLTETYDISEVYTNRDYEPQAIARDQETEVFLKKNGIGFYTFKDQVIFEKEEITTATGSPYKVFTPYSRSWREKYKAGDYSPLPDLTNHKNWHKSKPLDLPSLDDLGFEESTISIPNSSINKDQLKQYDEKRDYPAINGTSRLGIHLRFGTVGIREVVQKATNINDTWLNELIWREFYMQVLANFPHVVNQAFKKEYDAIPWLNNEADFQKWCDGKTGYPIVDAGMRELNNTGYMHNRVRMVVASFLTKHLLIDWRWGEAYFTQKLLDFELASNNGGWQWAAGTGTDAQPYFRVFNPQSQTEKFDPELKYIKKWVKEYGSKDYPSPMVEHKFARQRAIDTYKKALGK
ncbi:cryptochrome/photolyase family protein [Roseivirga pacifica]|uniref:cryptochrome/photolyase family protein n=1 Tax=Roseivirga pacifica TaxID=1267423 RepID=UPI002095DC22|nr:deoxyribodipyrimidine photo-lyase [Roseivirga pacifica]MCO6357621.1 deoxyribodipyrimidine photo-lyase [Roseivirga pacifica]MCO6365874.1 deoxyribodipyrimidine photo-lyase [Roseivirga pacifica]MCO6371202.1 deoxyribodipyrimidine photo-lyase [Roseivirga pacifica]MCO6375627.1 deoxyribodipyrimidine photo-lyase [Roseivirga pacifica]MCO6378580.1 deoxyribodipyrimidine photo-lyase [Roseivirga pacifica]